MIFPEPEGASQQETSHESRCVVLDHDVYALTSMGDEELHGAATSLSPAEIELLVRTDGRSTVAQIRESMGKVEPAVLAQTYDNLVRAGLIDLASNLASKSLDFTDFFRDEPESAPTDAAVSRANAEAAQGASTLQEHGYFVRIARRGQVALKTDPGQRPSVIVVEDEPVLGRFLKHFLVFEGFDVRLAANREEILNALKEPPLPHLVLLDVMLPDVDGFDVLLKIRQHPALQSVPVIMVTMKATREAVLKGLARGADGYVTKPVEPDTLMKAIKAVLGMAPRANANE
jgi:two-component system OmpR family response regulator